MNEVLVILCIFFFSVIGYSIIWFFTLLPREDTLFSLGVSFGLGSGLVAMQLYLSSRLGISWNLTLLIIPWLVFLSIVGILSRKSIKIVLPTIPRFSLFERILLVGIGLTVLYVIFEVLLRPLVVWDGWATWMLEAKVFFLDGRISYENLHYMTTSYPLLYPLLGTFVYEVLGKVDDTAVLLLSTAFYLFLSLSFFAVLKKKYGTGYALLWTFILMTTQNLIRHAGRLEAGIADLPQGYFIFCSSMLFLTYLQKKSTKVLLLFSVLLGFSALIKNEGTPFVFIMFVLLSFTFYRQKLYSHFFYLLIPIFFWGDWQIYKKVMDVDRIYALAHPLEISVQKSINAIVGMVREFLTLKSWNFVWLLYFYSFLIMKRSQKTLFYLNLIILFQIGAYFIVYLTTFGNNPESSFPRLLLHVLPLVIYVLAVQLKNMKNSFLTSFLG